MKNTSDIVTGFIVMGFTSIAAWELSNIDSTGSTDHLGAHSFPQVILVLLFVCACALIWQGFHIKSAQKPLFANKKVFKNIASFICWFIFYIALVIGLGAFFDELEIDMLQSNMGFLCGTFIYLVGAFLITGRRNPVEIFLTALLLPLGIVLSFGNFFQIFLP